MKKLAILLFVPIFLLGCNQMKIEDFSQNEPYLDLFEYFEGETEAWGIFEDRFGNVKRQFNVKISGVVEGDLLTLDERFVFDDGELDRRVWTIKRTGQGQYEGQADDVIGIAQGVVAGNALNWRYDLDLKVGDSSWRVHFNDWMFLQRGDVLINKAKVSKWGIEIGEVSIFFVRPAIAA